jgi:hypothetical protein
MLTILCLMRYEDRIRETEVRLSEHGELRRALGLASGPDYTKLYRSLRRPHEPDLEHALEEVVCRVPCRRRTRTTVAVDATGLAQGAVSTFFVRRMYHHTQQPLPWRHWLKWLAVVDVERQLILSQSARQGPVERLCNLPALIAQAHAHTPVALPAVACLRSVPSTAVGFDGDHMTG